MVCERDGVLASSAGDGSGIDAEGEEAATAGEGADALNDLVG